MTRSIENHPYFSFLENVEKPARYVGGEMNSIHKESVKARMVLAFPDVYDIGMSHLGFKILYDLINRDSQLAAERVFAPWIDLEKELRKRNLPLVSLESYLPLKNFDVVGFSLQYEMTYTNVLMMLELGGIPIHALDRKIDDPLVLAGGPCAMSPEPLSLFIDAFVLGDGEEITTQIIHFWKDQKEQGVSREEILFELSTWKGVYVPRMYCRERDPRTDLLYVRGPHKSGSQFPIERAHISDINQFPFPSRSPVAFTEVVFDRLSVELARGCTEGCRFCQAGMIYRPVRERNPKDVVSTILKGLDESGFDEASLTALSTADYSCVSPLIKELMAELRKRKVKLGVSSLRAYGLSEETLDEIADGGASGLTFAPEAGTQRMREVIAKNISEDEMLETARRVFSRGWQKVKLYFMIGLPTETDEDVCGIAETSRNVLLEGIRARKETKKPGRIQVTVSTSSHVPKPHTPFQWAGMDSLEEIQRKQRLIGQMAKKYGLEHRYHNARVSHIEGILSRGDQDVSKLIEAAYKKGCRFDGWDDQLKFDVWMECLHELNLDASKYLSTFPTDAVLPWEHIHVGVTRKFLLTEYRRSIQGRLSPPCGKPFGAKVHHTNLQDHLSDQRKLVCYDCGIACDLSDMRQERTQFLKSLNANEPLQREKSPNLRVGTVSSADHGEALRIRVYYRKLPPVSFVSHLDLVRMVPRHFRRANIPLALSGGFHPRPELVFGPALPLGVWGLNEAFDVLLKVKMDTNEVLQRLHKVADPGIEYIHVSALQPADLPLSKFVVGGVYRFYFVSEESKNHILDCWERNLPLEVKVLKKGRERKMDLRNHLVKLHSVIDSEVYSETHPFGLEVWVDFRLGGSLRSHLFFQAFGVEPHGSVILTRERYLAEGDFREGRDALVAKPRQPKESLRKLPTFSHPLTS